MNDFNWTWSADECGRTADCEFCAELSHSVPNRFADIYGPSLSRVLIRQSGFVVLPTIGQIFEGSLLILPECHVERMAALPSQQRETCLELVEVVVSRLSSYGNPIVFEHGAAACTNGACGIYHAHLHVVPVPHDSGLQCHELMPTDQFETSATLSEALANIAQVEEYLLLRATNREVAYLKITPEFRPLVPSQWFRRRLAERFDLRRPWDWRLYGIEPWLLATLHNSALCDAA